MNIKGTPFHLTYCTNIHPGEAWIDTFTQLEHYILSLKDKLSPEQPFGIGLRLSNRAATDLLTANTLANFKAWLAQHHLYLLTINGFVYGHFHGMPVKDHVYAPDWSTVERADYSFKLLQIMTVLTPASGRCGFSSAPISYQPWLNGEQQKERRHIASLQLAKLVLEMVRIEQTEDKYFHIDLEPEPDCLLMTTTDIIDFFAKDLLPHGAPYLMQALGITRQQANAYLLRHVQVCYDVCHLAVAFEEPASVFSRLAAAGIQIGKMQISTALQVLIPPTPSAREQLRQQLIPFADATYLHQVVARNSEGNLQYYPDLPQALADLDSTSVQEWRIHFHLPIFIEQCPYFQTTQGDLLKALVELQHQQATHCLEIETYTWEVLPADLKLELTDSLEREYRWVLQQFNQ